MSCFKRRVTFGLWPFIYLLILIMRESAGKNNCSDALLYASRYLQNTCFKWFEEVRNILISCGNIGFWDSLNFPNKNWLLKSTKQKLTDLYFNEWNNTCSNKTFCYIYELFKTSFGFENYLTKVPFKLRKYLIQIRTRNHRIPVEKGRWRRIPREKRKCQLYSQDIEDEIHYILSCRKLNNLRRQYLDPYDLFHPNTYKFGKLLNSKNISM